MMSWKPLESGNKNKLTKLSEIADVLLNKKDQSGENINLLSGKTGEAVFFYYYSRFTKNKKYADHGFQLLTEVFEEINNGFSFHTYAGGFAGIGWAIEHLVKNGFLETETTKVLDELDDYLFNCMMDDIKKGNYDYLHGAIGNGIYFLSRSNRKKVDEYLKALINELENLGEEDITGAIKWRSIIDIETNLKGYNISLSHGISSIIVFLSKAYENKIHKKTTLKLLSGAVTYLLQQQLNSNKFTSSFPSMAIETREPDNSRLAWCYGDLGIGMALWQAAQSTGNKSWKKKAIEVLLDSTKRKDLKESMVMDSGLCHGSSGIAHIYNRIYFSTGIKEFKKSSMYWFNETIKMAVHKDGFAGYKTWRSEKLGGWVKNKTLLEGIAGIGLALISALSDNEPKWDECLLLS